MMSQSLGIAWSSSRIALRGSTVLACTANAFESGESAAICWAMSAPRNPGRATPAASCGRRWLRQRPGHRRAREDPPCAAPATGRAATYRSATARARDRGNSLGGVMAEAGARADHQFGFGEALAGEVAGEGAGDIERVGIALETGLAQQRGGKQRAGLLGPAPPAGPSAGADGAAAGPSTIGSRPSAIISTTRSTIAGSGKRPLRRGHQLGRRV